MPDSPESRLGRLEMALAKVEQRVDDIFSLAIANVTQDIEQLTIRVADLSREVRNDRDAARKRGEEQAQERKQDRRYMFGSLMAATGLIISATAVIVSVAI